MHLAEGKAKFIESWGALGTNWGVSRTMAQIHALLMISSRPLCCDQIMAHLSISRGNASMNIRALMDWDLIRKVLKPGDRKDYYEAEKDVITMLKLIILQRKKRELDPMVKVLEEISLVESNCQDSAEFCRMVRELKLFSRKADTTLENILASKSNWLYQAMFKAM
jgi:DNA-binding transcriptional regulator GbsR (MarR family)